MKIVGDLPVAQGDLYIRRVDGLPKDVIVVSPEGGKVIVGHSETGHHHVMTPERVTMYRLPEEIYSCFLVVGETDELRHLRSFDTHESYQLPPGTYEVRRQRERAHVPEGWRRAAD